MNYVLTEHAREVLKKRQILLTWIERVFITPEATEADSMDPQLEHRLARIPEFNNRVLRVVVNNQKTPLHIVTVFFDRRRTLP